LTDEDGARNRFERPIRRTLRRVLIGRLSNGCARCAAAETAGAERHDYEGTTRSYRLLGADVGPFFGFNTSFPPSSGSIVFSPRTLLHMLTSAAGTSRRCPTVGFQTIAAMRREVGVANDPQLTSRQVFRCYAPMP